MAQGSCSRRNVPPSTVSTSEPEQPTSPEEGTPVPSVMGPPDAPAPNAPSPNAPVPAPGLALASTNELFKQFMKAYPKAQTLAPIQAEPWE